MIAALCLWACVGQDLTRPPADAPDAEQPLVQLPGARHAEGPLSVTLTTPLGARGMSAMLWLQGPAIDSVRAPGLQLFESGESAPGVRRVVVAGDLSVEAILEIWVPAGSDVVDYRVELLEVAGEDYSLQVLDGYSVSVR